MSRNSGIRKRLQANIETIVEKWKKHTTLNDLADQYNCSTATLCSVIKAHVGGEEYKRIARENFKFGHSGNTQRIYEDLDQIEQRFRNHEGLTTIIADYHVNPTTLTKALLTRMTRDEYRNINRKTLSRCGRKTRLEPGHTPWNKDLKGIHLSPQSEFQKGHLPANHKSKMTVSVRTHRGIKTRWVKVSGLLEGEHKWIPYAIWLWEEHHGPVPKNMLVIHKDGNTLNDNIDNLERVSRADHLSRIKQRDPLGVERRRVKALRKAQKKRKKRTAADKKNRYYVNKIIQKVKQPDRVIWMCSSCGHTYDGNTPPSQCTKCNRGGFEKNVIPQRMAI